METLYRAFGLNFRAPAEWLPLRLAEGTASADVNVAFGAVPPDVPGAVVQHARFTAKPGVLLYRTRSIADYYIEDGRRVTVAPKPGCGPLELVNLTLGAISGAVLMQRSVAVLHACVVDTPGGAVVVCGRSGAGKSTLAMLLLRRGFRILDDNLAPLVRSANGWQVAFGTGFLRLTPESYALLGDRTRGPSFSAPSFVKHVHVLRDTEWTSCPRPLRAIWLLDRHTPELRSSLSVREKVAALRAHWFVSYLAPGLGQSRLLFDATVRLAGVVPMARLGQPPSMRLDDWADAVARLTDG